MMKKLSFKSMACNRYEYHISLREHKHSNANSRDLTTEGAQESHHLDQETMFFQCGKLGASILRHRNKKKL